MNLRNRYVLIVAAMLVAMMLALLGLGAWQDARYSAANASDRLDGIQRAQQLVERQEHTEIITRAELIANNQAVASYIVQALGESLPGMEQDSASIVDLLMERRDQLGLELIAVLDDQGRVVAATERFADSNELGRAPLFLQARQSKTASKGLWLDDRRLLHVAVLPLAAYGYSEIFLLVGMPVNQLLAQSIAEFGLGDVAFVAITPEGPQITASTLTPAMRDVVLPQLPAGTADQERVDFRVDGRRYHVSSSPLFGSTSGRLVALVSPHPDDRSAAALRLPMVVGGLAVLAAIGLLAWLLWARLLAPVERLTTIIDHAASSDDMYVRAQETGAAPVARLAAAFNRLLPAVERRKRRRSAGPGS